MEPTWNDENDAQRVRLNELLDSLDQSDYGADLGEGWTVGAALGHLAFWDRRGARLFEHWKAGNIPPAGLPAWYEDLPNEVLLEEWTALAASEAGRLAREAATEIDATVRALPSEIVQAVLARNELWRMRRAAHRAEHIQQIRSALGK